MNLSESFTRGLLHVRSDSRIHLRSRLSPRAQALVLPLLATYLGLMVRLAHVMAGGFPINDGGMFMVMVRDIQQANYALPDFISYNGDHIPFAYPPLPFYFAAIVDQLGPWSLLDVIRFLPLIFSVITVPAVYLLARRLLPNEFMAGIAAMAFALLPRAFNWEIAGGGLTRAPGMLFAVLAIHQAHVFYSERTRRAMVLTPVLAALTVLCHLEMGVLVAATCTVFLVALAWERSMVIASTGMALAATLLTAPWWLVVLAKHGTAPLVSAVEAGNHVWYVSLSLLFLRFTEEPLFPLLAALGLLGIFVCLLERKFLLPAWLLLLFVVDSRKAATDAMLPLSMLIAIGVSAVVLPLAAHIPAVFGERMAGVRRDQQGKPLGAQALVGLIVLFYAVVGAVVVLPKNNSPLHILQPEQRQAMAWVADSTPPDSRFLVVTGSASTWTDEVSEWFPALTSRESLATVQGSEWIGGQKYRYTLDYYDDLQECAQGPVACLPLQAGANPAPDYVYVARAQVWGSDTKTDCCTGLIEALRTSDRFVMMYDGEGAAIFEVIR